MIFKMANFKLLVNDKQIKKYNILITTQRVNAQDLNIHPLSLLMISISTSYQSFNHTNHSSDVYSSGECQGPEYSPAEFVKKKPPLMNLCTLNIRTFVLKITV
jgi:hypothetical protein